MKFLYPIKKLNLKPWIKYWLLKKTSKVDDNLFIDFPNSTITSQQELTNGIVTIKQTFNYTKQLTINNNVITGNPTIGNGSYYIWKASFKNLKPNTKYFISASFEFYELTGNVSSNFIFNNRFFTNKNETFYSNNTYFEFVTNSNGEYEMAQFINIGLADFSDNSSIKIFNIQLKEVK